MATISHFLNYADSGDSLQYLEVTKSVQILPYKVPIFICILVKFSFSCIRRLKKLSLYEALLFVNKDAYERIKYTTVQKPSSSTPFTLYGIFRKKKNIISSPHLSSAIDQPSKNTKEGEYLPCFFPSGKRRKTEISPKYQVLTCFKILLQILSCSMYLSLTTAHSQLMCWAKLIKTKPNNLQQLWREMD